MTAIKESENKSDKTGTLTLQPTSVSINGGPIRCSASIDRRQDQTPGSQDQRGRHRQGRRRVPRPARLLAGCIGGSTKGAIIGGVLGGAVGAQRAVETKDRDVVLPAGHARSHWSLDEQLPARQLSPASKRSEGLLRSSV